MIKLKSVALIERIERVSLLESKVFINQVDVGEVAMRLRKQDYDLHVFRDR